MKCYCNQPSPLCSYRFSDGEQDVFKSTLKLVLDRETERVYKCSACSTVWCASCIPGGGIYGDVEWINISLPHWRKHWYWAMNK